MRSHLQSAALQSAYNAKVKHLLDSYSQPHDGNHALSHTLSLSAPAYSLWRDFQATIETQLRPDGKFLPCLGWAGKISGFALRIAGLLHIVENDLQTLTILESTMMNALDIATRLTEHALAAFSLMGLDQPTNDAKSIYQWLKSLKSMSFTQSEIVLAMRNKKLGKPERLLKALTILQTRNIISAPIKLATRKPTTLYYVNPLLKSGEHNENQILTNTS